MSFRHRWLAVSLALAVGIPLSHPRPIHAGQDEKGSVGLRDLIVLALQNDPGLVALRSNIPVEVAKKRAAVQWRDPEIRVGFAKDDNLQLDQPYTRSGTATQTTGVSGNRQEIGGLNGSASQRGNSTENRTTNYTEKIIPGKNSDRIIRTETESRRTDANVTESDNRGTFNKKSSESEVFRSTTDETRFHGRDLFARDETASIKVRFWIPKPWEKKALVNQAAKEVDLANYEVTAAERGVILEVREQYEDLQYLFKKLEASRRQIAVIEQHVANEKALLDAGGAFTLDQLSFEDIKIPGIKLAIDAAETELNAAKRALAARVGLADGSRIRVTDKLLRSSINLQGADLDYLTDMAFAHRGEVGILKHEQAIAKAELGIVKSKRIPWFSFIEGGYAQDVTGGDFTNDNYGVQVGVVLPLFSWLAKDIDVVEARIESYYASLEANQKNIANEVAEAFRSVKEATGHRSRTEAAVAQHAKAMEERAKGLEASEDLAAKEKLRYDTEIERYKLYDYILAADRLFNQSLIRLEQALGADLDQIFKVEFEPLADFRTGSYEVIASAASSPPAAPVIRAKPVPETPDSKSESEVEKPKRKGLFNFLKQ